MDLFFQELDRDFDGRLSLEEFMGEETPIEKLFKLMDKNRDGFITKKVKKITFESLRIKTNCTGVPFYLQETQQESGLMDLIKM